ncbi:MAG: Nif3-like dinuclear metal center hexameric protein [Deltaproteobacteria bacterium]|nr:Nif3-like dinuclear metal center hexameric protein [Deltaproteobacteria bacterium]
MATVANVLSALDTICAGRLIKRAEDAFGRGSPFVVVKTSHLPGKAVTETPGLVVGSPEKPVHKLAVSMTLTESQIELAGATGVDAIICHHPVADAASSGGVPLRGYADLYNLAVFEAHEAFHGRHPGIAFIHGHKPIRVEIAYGGLPGNIMFVGKTLEEVKTVGDVIDRLGRFCDLTREESFLELERRERECSEINETCIAVSPQILCGTRDDRVNFVVHFFPHTGFTTDHLRQVKHEHPDIDTAIVSISRVKGEHPLVQTARDLGINMIAGNSHALEILENGLPMAFALQELLPEVEIYIFRERVTSVPISRFGSEAVRQYGRTMSSHLLK